MNKSFLAAMTLVLAGSTTAHAGLLDTLSKVNQAVNTVRGNSANVPVVTPAPAQLAADHSQLMQSYAALDCASLQAMSNSLTNTLAQQLQAVPQENQVSKTAGMLGKAGGLFASVGALAGVDVRAVQQAGQMAQQANSLAANTSTAAPQNVVELNQQLAALQVIQQARACK
ncbi:hypothetical protein [Alkanindiges illinoisensis]|uniref:hypothetical protein n=1 Tax=Alkanindiges illinoisensis TaxID=197183 RepID=UPI00047AA943|nr:hypothetical protein [Alkanindiges illinoisensis]